jgi:general secretion pathway protein A
VLGRSFHPLWVPWATGTAVAAIAIVSVALLLPRFLAQAAPAATPAAASTPAAEPAAAPAPDLAELLARYSTETNPDDAFAKLFALWGIRYVAGGEDPCTQALRAGLECLTQRGSLAQLRLFNRPAVLNVIDDDGGSHQLVLAGLDGEHAQIALGDAQREIGIGDLSRSWFGDYVLLWRSGSGASGPLALGARNARVKWLRDSLRRVNGLPPDETPSDQFDASLVTMVEEFQRKNRLAVDGIAGVQTQVALDAALNDGSTPFLHEATGS